MNDDGAFRQQLHGPEVDVQTPAAAETQRMSVHQLFETQARRTPDTIAVVFGGAQLSYAELNRRANQVAHYLRKRGIGPDQCVGICMERSLVLAIGALGVLKAGGAYVPLDPAYPQERLAFMLEDAQVALLLTATTDDPFDFAAPEPVEGQGRRRPTTDDRQPEPIHPLTRSPAHPLTAVVDLIAGWATLAQEPATNPDSGVAPDNLAYAIYTSGSTGRPKGVAMTHGALCNMIAWQMAALPEPARTLQFASFSFDVSFQEFFTTWCSGGTIVLISEEQRRDLGRLPVWLQEAAIERTFLPPVVLQHIADTIDESAPVPMLLRQIITAGEQLRITRSVARLFERLGGCALHNHYGPSESHVVTEHVLAGAPGSWPAFPPIGRPIANTQIYLLDPALQPVPIGVPGELYIGGVGLARGYLNRPELTAERFVPDPFVTTTDDRRPTTDSFDKVTRRQGDKVTESEDVITRSPVHLFTPSEQSAVGGQWSVVGGRLYRTGDRARYRADGTIEFLERIDQQVKLRGFRIEPGEIEAVLTAHPAVRQAVVVVREDVPGDKRLVAYVVPDREQRTKNKEQNLENQEPRTKNQELIVEDSDSQFSVLGSGESSQFSVLGSGIGELRAFISKRLPAYMIPSAFVLLERLPLSPNGKLDRRALPAPDPARPDRDAAFVAPRTALEHALAALWQDRLHTGAVGRHANFFELGGDSIQAAIFINKLQEQLGEVVPAAAIYDAPTVADLADYLMTHHPNASLTIDGPAARDRVTSALSPISRQPRDGSVELPLSFAQQRLWFAEQFEPGSPGTIVFAAVRLAGALDPALLRRSFNQVVRRHEVLCTAFVLGHDRPRLLITPVGAGSAPLSLPVLDLRALARPRQESEVLRLATAEAQRPFDLTRGRLLRTTLLRLGAQEYILLLAMHHIISDGWSIGIMIREATTLYQSSVSGQPDGRRESPLPELPIQYADFAHWQRGWLQGALLEQKLAYWRAHLDGAPKTLALPTDYPRRAFQSMRGVHRPVVLAPALTEALVVFSRREGVTLFMTLLAAFNVLLHRYSGQDDIVVGSPIAGRTRAEIEPLIGYFINTLALRTNLAGNPTFRELLRRVRAVTIGAYEHQDLPFEQMVREVMPTHDLNRAPLFQVMFALQNVPIGALDVAGLSIRPLEIDNPTAKFDLGLSLSETDQGLAGVLQYLADLFDEATIERMLGNFQTLLQNILAGPERRIAELLPLPEVDQQPALQHTYERAAARRDTLRRRGRFEQPRGTASQQEGSEDE